MKNLNLLLTIALLAPALTGCSTVKRSWDTLVSARNIDVDDPLMSEEYQPRETYLNAKKELKEAPRTMLAFAGWNAENGSYVEARSAYQDILGDDPNCLEARLGIARIEFQTGRKQQAEKILQATVSKFPKSAETQLELGRLYAMQEQWEKAVPVMKHAVVLAGSDQDLSRNCNYELGLALARSNRHQEALAPLTIATGRSSAMYNIGFLLSQEGRLTEAAEWMQQSIASNPDERTRASAEQLLASLATKKPTMNIAAAQPKSEVDIAQTTYKSFREVPNPERIRGNEPALPAAHSSAESNMRIQPGQPGQSDKKPVQLLSGQRPPLTTASASRPASVLPTRSQNVTTPATPQRRSASAWQSLPTTPGALARPTMGQPSTNQPGMGLSNTPPVLPMVPRSSPATFAPQPVLPSGAMTNEPPQWRPVAN